MYVLLGSQRNLRRTCLGMDPQIVNVVQLGVGFLFIFSAFNSQGFIVQMVIESYFEQGKVGKHDGYISMSIIYAVFTFANFVAAPIVMCLNARWAMVFGGITYCLFQLGFLFINQAYLFASSALVGLGAAVIWTAQGKYLALNSTNETAQKNSGVFWAISQACIIFGGILFFFVFKDFDKITNETVRILYGVFTVVTLIGIVILAGLRFPLPASSTVSIESLGQVVEQPQLTYKEIIASTIKLARTKQMLVMAVVFAYSGVELSFWSAVYPTCIGNTNKLGKISLALNAVAQGLGQASSGFLFGILSSKTGSLGRDRIVLLGALVHLLAFIGIFINFPANASLGKTDNVGIIEPSIPIAIICGFLLGFGDACWNTQIFVFLISKYSSKSAQAFSLFKFFQSLLSCVAFAYSSKLILQYHLLILVVGAVIACACFFLAEKMPNNDNRDDQVQHND